MQKFFDTIRKESLTIGNNSGYDYLLDAKNDRGITLTINQKELQDRIRSGHYIPLG